MSVKNSIRCIVLLLSINKIYAQNKGKFIFFDKKHTDFYEEIKTKDGIYFYIGGGRYNLFHRNGMQQKKVGDSFLKGEKILDAIEAMKFLSNVYHEKYEEAEKQQILVLVLEFVYRPDPPIYIVKKTQYEYLLYEVEWEPFSGEICK